METKFSAAILLHAGLNTEDPASLRHLKHCSWELCSSGILHSLTGCLLPNIPRQQSGHIIKGQQSTEECQSWWMQKIQGGCDQWLTSRKSKEGKTKEKATSDQGNWVLSVCLCLPVCLSACLSVCLSVCMRVGGGGGQRPGLSGWQALCSIHQDTGGAQLIKK
jgi:hypothetical protein